MTAIPILNDDDDSNHNLKYFSLKGFQLPCVLSRGFCQSHKI